MKELKYSVIIPTFNRADVLNTCLTYLNQLDAPEYDWEILVVDNGSTDNTREAVKAAQKKNEKIKYVFEPRPGLHMGRHAGCDSASGEILCYIDDDSFVFSTWLKGIEESFDDPNVAIVGGACLPLFEETPPEWLKYFWTTNKYGKVLHYLSLFDFGNKKMEVNPASVFGCNFAIRKKLFIAVGGSMPDCMPRGKEIYQGDGETAVGRKLSKLGYKAIYSPKAKIHHFVSKSRLTVDYFLSNARYKGIGKSFVDIRVKFGLETENFVSKNNILLSIIKRRFKKTRKYIGELRRLLPIGQPYYVAKIKRDVFKEVNASHHFHQNEIKRNPKLKEWVLRENYLDRNGELPG